MNILGGAELPVAGKDPLVALAGYHCVTAALLGVACSP